MMSITYQQDGIFTIVSMAGRFDAIGTREFKKTISQLLETGKNRIVLDMSHVNFVDSSGMGALIGTLRGITKEGGDMRIFGLTPEVHTIFELTRLHRIFDIYETIDAAMAAV
jgi:anti-sigma B factor antagonist